MKKNLVIVESPSKSKTIEKYLGSDYKVVSSKGHICDLATRGKEGLGVDVDNNFEPIYTINKDKKDVVKELQKLAEGAENIYLASDPDREGEAIAWHLARELKLDEQAMDRIVFHEVTKPAVLEALKNPRTIDMDLVRSQETRRILDRIIGFKLSKLLQKKIQSKSAGRVQSVALKLIVDRENEILNFICEEYWTIHGMVTKNKKVVETELSKVDGNKPEIKNEQEADVILNRLKEEYTVTSVVKKGKKKQPKLPFTTSTLQQEASTKLNMGAKKTMSVAQKLYEGVNLGGTTTGLITYMRSDSTRLSDIFVGDAKAYIEKEFGKKYVGSYKTKNNSNSQDAHEAIRPTDINNTPEAVKPYLSNDEFRLYSMIYARTVASLMAAASFDVTTVTLENNGCEFKASGQVMVFDGYTQVYSKYEKQSEQTLPAFSEGEVLKDVKVEKKQHFTEPPSRYTEAKLIKELEEKSIGRPSTYATIIDTIQKRGYVTLEKQTETSKTKYFIPSEQGVLTNDSLSKYFSQVINVKYTANMEGSLDKIADGEINNISYLHEFYDKFNPLVESAYDKMPKKELEKIGKLCPKCGGDLVIRNGKYGKFISCINFPTCHYTESQETEKPAEGQEQKECPNCGKPMIIKKGRYGPFWACSDYPECKTIVPLKEKAKPEPTGEMCPECGKELVRRKSRFGTFFVGCSNYPKCHFIKKEPKEKKK